MEELVRFVEYCQLQGLSPRTIKALDFAVNIYLRRFPDPFSVTEHEVLTFFSQGKALGFASNRPASASRYNNIRNSLNKFYRWAIDHGVATSNPIAKIPRCRMPKAVPRRLTAEEKARVLFHAQNFPNQSRFLRTRNYAIVAALLMTGLRARELLALQNEDVCFTESFIQVRSGKGQRERRVFIGDELPPILRAYLHERDRLGRTSLFFFISYRSNLPLRYKNLRAVLGTVARRSGVRFTDSHVPCTYRGRDRDQWSGHQLDASIRHERPQRRPWRA